MMDPIVIMGFNTKWWSNDLDDLGDNTILVDMMRETE